MGKIITEIEKGTKHIAKATFEIHQVSWMRELHVFEFKCENTGTTPEEMDFYKQFVAQVAITHQTTDHLNELLKARKGDCERGVKKTLDKNNIDIDSYHDGSIVGNHCI